MPTNGKSTNNDSSNDNQFEDLEKMFRPIIRKSLEEHHADILSVIDDVHEAISSRKRLDMAVVYGLSVLLREYIELTLSNTKRQSQDLYHIACHAVLFELDDLVDGCERIIDKLGDPCIGHSGAKPQQEENT